MSHHGLRASGSGAPTAVGLLRAACDLVGGEELLARRLNMSVALLKRFLSGRNELPPHLLLRTVDLLLEEQDSRLPAAAGPAGPAGESRHDTDLSGLSA